MKKLIAAAAILSLAVGAWAQGQIDFRNAGVTFIEEADRLVYNANGVGAGNELGSAADGSTAYVAGLFFVPGADGSPGAMNLAGPVANMRAETSSRIGQWTNAGIPEGNTRTLEGVTAGQTATVQVRVWDSAAFGSFAEAVAGGGLWGASDPWNYTVPQPGSPPDRFYLNGLRAFALVPEPSVIALGVLGAASLLLFRRRK